MFTISGFIGGIFALTAPLFTKRWGKLRIITTVMLLSAPLMILTGFAPTLPLAVSGEYMRTLIDPVYAAFEMEQVSDRYRSTLAGCYSVTWSIGYSIGPSVAGWLQTYVSLSAASMLLSFFGKKHTRSAQ